MGKKYFFKFVSEPKTDPLKTIVGLACVNQAISEGHDVSVFFAASGTRTVISPENPWLGPASLEAPLPGPPEAPKSE